ncbi:50S ribosomal protein L21e [Candidatus Woesearchaeota archaeon]|nr:50S ribosomal protein L21e [Candidatus Woesearchaeota archaeon]
MAGRLGGMRRKTRALMRKNVRAKGKISIKNYLQKFQTGEKVYLIADSSVHEGMFFPRYHNKSGEVIGKKGTCYEVMIHDGSVKKIMIVHPVHLKRV